jgi:hypothetical protein
MSCGIIQRSEIQLLKLCVLIILSSLQVASFQKSVEIIILILSAVFQGLEKTVILVSFFKLSCSSHFQLITVKKENKTHYAFQQVLRTMTDCLDCIDAMHGSNNELWQQRKLG